MKRLPHQINNGKPANLRERGLRTLARIIAKVYLDRIRAEREGKSES